MTQLAGRTTDRGKQQRKPSPPTPSQADVNPAALISRDPDTMTSRRVLNLKTWILPSPFPVQNSSCLKQLGLDPHQNQLHQRTGLQNLTPISRPRPLIITTSHIRLLNSYGPRRVGLDQKHHLGRVPITDLAHLSPQAGPWDAKILR